MKKAKAWPGHIATQGRGSWMKPADSKKQPVAQEPPTDKEPIRQRKKMACPV